MATFADRFKQLREESGLTQEELARRLGVSKGTVGNYESGARTPRKLDDLNSLADYFNVEIDYEKRLIVSTELISTGAGGGVGEIMLGGVKDENGNDIVKTVSPKIKVVVSTYYKGTSLDGALRKIEEFIDKSDDNNLTMV